MSTHYSLIIKCPEVNYSLCDKHLLNLVLIFWVCNLKDHLTKCFWCHIMALKGSHQYQLMLLFLSCSLRFQTFFYIISGKMVLSKKRLSLQGGDLPSETDLPQETHVSFIATVRNSDVHSTIQRIYCGLILVTLCWQGHKSKKEVMMEIISKSKFYKVEYTCHLVILSLNILIYLGSVSPYVIDAFLVWYCYLEHLSL